MFKTTTTALLVPAMLFLAGCASPSEETAQADTNMAHVHMGHVLTSWQDTPDQQGLLPTAVAEAEIATQHAGFAAERPDDLAWMKLHIGHVMHAIDPSTMGEGPGLGYGVRQAAAGTAKHIQFAAESEGASDNVKLHATHVATSANNVVAWSDEILSLARQVESAQTAAEAAPLVERIKLLTQAILNGVDANGDGKVSWEQGEGGLAQAQQHMGFMKEGEGLV